MRSFHLLITLLLWIVFFASKDGNAQIVLDEASVDESEDLSFESESVVNKVDPYPESIVDEDGNDIHIGVDLEVDPVIIDSPTLDGGNEDEDEDVVVEDVVVEEVVEEVFRAFQAGDGETDWGNSYTDTDNDDDSASGNSIAKLESTEMFFVVEAKLRSSFAFCKKNKDGIKAFAGVVLTIFGDRFLYTTLVSQAVSSGGLPNLKKSWNELSLAYKESREKIKEDARLSGISGSSIAAAEVRKRPLFLSSLQRSIDPDKIKSVLTNFLATFTIALASVTSATAGAITMGLSMGHAVSSKLIHVGERFANKLNLKENPSEREKFVKNMIATEYGKKWFKSMIQLTTNTAAILFAAKFQRLGMVLSTCALGSQMVMDSARSLIDPWLERFGFESIMIRHWPIGADVLQTGIMWLGFLYTVRPGASGPPLYIALPLLPFLVVEKILKSLVRARI